MEIGTPSTPARLGWRALAAMTVAAILAFASSRPMAAADDDPSSGRDPQKQIDEAHGFFNLGRYQYAEKAYREFLVAHSSHPLASEAMYFLAESLRAEGRTKDARAAYHRLLEKYPNNPHADSARFRIGETSYHLGDDAEAERALSDWTAQHPSDPLLEYALSYLGDVFLRTHKDAEALASYRKELDRFPEGKLAERARLGMAQALSRQGKIQEAVAALHRVLDGGGKLAEQAALELGNIEFEAGRYAPAADAYARLEEKFPASSLLPQARLNRGLALYNQHQYDAARALFAELRASAPPDEAARATYWLGQTYGAIEHWARASEVLWAGFEKYPDAPLAPEMLYDAADAELQQKHYARAIERFNLVGKRFPASPQAPKAVYSAGLAAYSDGRYAYTVQLAAYFARYFKESPLAERMGLLAAQAELELKQSGPAIERLEALHGAKLDPLVATAVRYQLARAYAAQNQAERALRMLRELFEADPKSAVANEARFLLGTLEFKAKHYAAAAAAFAQSAAAAPHGETAAAALGNLARAHAELGHWDEAAAAAARLRREDSAGKLSGRILAGLADAAFRAEQYGRAARWYEEADAAGAESAGVLSGLGWARYRTNDYAAARAAFAKLVEKFPDDALAPEALFLEGRSAEAAKEPAEAERAYRAVLDRYAQSPEAARAGLQLAHGLARRGRLAEAAETYTRLDQRFPAARTAEMLSDWAFVCIDLKQVDQARAIFARLIEEFPQSPLALQGRLNLAQADYDAGNYRKVIDALRPLENQTLDPPDKQAVLFNLGRAAVGLKDWAAVRSAFTALAREYPRSELAPEARFWAAEADYQEEKYAAAAEKLEALTTEINDAKAQPWLPDAWLELAECRLQLRQWKEALAAAERVESHFPGFRRAAEALYVRGRALQSDAQFDLAREAYRKAVANGRGVTAAKAQFMIGETFFLERRYDRAEPELLKAYIDFPRITEWAAPALLESGKCAEQLKRPADAVRTYEQVLAKYGQTRFAAEARTRLEALRNKRG